MTKQIRKLSSLPEWFELSKYTEVNSLDSVGWYEQLSVRNTLLTMVARPTWRRSGGSVPGEMESSSALALVRAKPIVDIGSDELLSIYFMDGALHELKRRDPQYSRGVHLATVRNLYLTEGHIEEDKRTYARHFFDQIFGNEKLTSPLKYGCKDWIDQPVDDITKWTSFQVNVCVDLSLPHKLLVKQFSQMIRSLRTGVLDNRKLEFKSWVRFNVLPYLDLQIWEREYDLKISNRVMADAIFLPGEGGEEVVRKTTSEIAKELMTRKSLETLAALAAYEIAEQNDC